MLAYPDKSGNVPTLGKEIIGSWSKPDRKLPLQVATGKVQAFRIVSSETSVPVREAKVGKQGVQTPGNKTVVR